MRPSSVPPPYAIPKFVQDALSPGRVAAGHTANPAWTAARPAAPSHDGEAAPAEWTRYSSCQGAPELACRAGQ
jgi:hypothetical protein